MSNMLDRREKFARNWKLIGISSSIKKFGSRLHYKITAQIIKNMVDKFGEDGVKVIKDASYQIGLEDGKLLSQHLRITDTNAPACLAPIEITCLLSGMETEYLKKENNKAILQVKGCPFKDIFPKELTTIFCENYIKGVVQSINQNAVLTIKTKYLENKKYCEFVVSI